MNSFRHHLAEFMAMREAPHSVLAIAGLPEEAEGGDPGECSSDSPEGLCGCRQDGP